MNRVPVNRAYVVVNGRSRSRRIVVPVSPSYAHRYVTDIWYLELEVERRVIAALPRSHRIIFRGCVSSDEEDLGGTELMPLFPSKVAPRSVVSLGVYSEGPLQSNVFVLDVVLRS